MSKFLRDSLSLYDTMSRTISHFTPAEGNTVRMYICGPTVYSSPHIGNMRTYFFGDTLRRVLRFAGYDLKSAMNITDVGHLTSDADTGDDKMAKAAATERLTAWAVAERYTKVFFNDATRLNILPTERVLLATDHIEEQIALIDRLDSAGVLYRTSDGVYFDTARVSDYGKLTPNDTREHLLSGNRVSMGEKRHATDFAVWKFSPSSGPRREMEWTSPWGVGFPGWHIECSAMAMGYLGETLDLHLGGVDHIAIHHTNEIAQSETATGVPFSRWWMHGALLSLDGARRMGKSEGNKITLDTLLADGFEAMDVRYLYLLSHYRSPLSFSVAALEKARNAMRRLHNQVDRWYKTIGEVTNLCVSDDDPYLKSFVEAMSDDLNTPRALAELWGVVRDPNLEVSKKLSLLLAFDEMLGLGLNMPLKAASKVPSAVAKLARERWTMRSNGQYKEADDVRDRIARAGYAVHDRQDGYEIVPIDG